MTAVTVIARKQEVAAAKLMAISNAVELNHRYRMARVAAEQEAIRMRRRQNFWRSARVRRTLYAAMLMCGIGIGVLASRSGAFSPADRAHQTSSPPQAPTAAPATALATPADPAPTSPATDAAQTLVALDAIDVPFVRSVGRLGRNGASVVSSFARLNMHSPHFVVTGIRAQGETDDTARARALSVVDLMQAQGIDRASIDVQPVIPSDEDGSILMGARIAAMGHASRPPSAIVPGAPIASLDGSPSVPTPLRPAFEQQPTQAAQFNASAGDVAQKAEPADSAELAQAIQSAAARSKAQRNQTTPAGSANREGPGVFVRMPDRETAKAGATQGASSTPPATDQPKAPYSIVSRLDGAVLVKVGNEVRHVKVGEALPDGKILGADLKASGG